MEMLHASSPRAPATLGVFNGRSRDSSPNRSVPPGDHHDLRRAVRTVLRPVHAVICPRTAADLIEARPMPPARPLRWRWRAVALDQLLSHFAGVSTVVPRTRLDFLWTLDRASPSGCLKTLTVLSNGITAARGTEMKVHGDAFLMPPALRGEGRSRSDWVQRVGLEPPRRRDACGPYWRLGQREAWRLDVLSWHERQCWRRSSALG
jgi:hypothetical protein